MRQRNQEILLTVALITIFLLLWQIIAINGLVKKEYISYPTEVIRDLMIFYQSGDLLLNLFATTYEAFSGLVIGTIVGVLTAIFLGYYKILGRIFEPIIVVINSIPQIALAPIYIMWFGIGYGSKIFMSSLLVFFLVFFSTFNGVKNSEKQLYESAALLGANDFTILFRVTLPTIVPWIITGVKAGIGASLIGAIVGEYLGATKGLGWAISFATSYFDMARVMSCLVLLLFVGYVCNKVLVFFETRLMKYRGR